MVVKAGGAALGPPALPLVPPVRIQLEGEPGQCWQAEYAAPDVGRNDASMFRARGTAP